MYLFGPYDSALEEILENGVSRTNKRTGIKTLSVFGMMRRYRLDTEYFPIMTRRKCWPKSVFAELLWFISGSTSNKDLKALGCNFWTPWVDPDFEKKHGYVEEQFGPVYGFSLRHFGGYYGNGAGGKEHTSGTSCPNQEPNWNNEWLEAGDSMYGAGGFDQLQFVIDRINEDPSCRRILWTLWNPHDVGKMRLPPCHFQVQIMIDDERRLTLMLTQRSCDAPVGCPANIQFYSALATMIAQQTNCIPHEFVHVTGDTHIYEDQIDAVREYLATPIIDSPKLRIEKANDIDSYTPESFVLTDFQTGPKIEIPVAI